MTPSKNLFLLIKSLSKSEKIYFRKAFSRYQSKSETVYLKLFNEINKHRNIEAYDENAIKLKLLKEGLVTNFEVTKYYLQKIILRSLSSFYEVSTLDSRLNEDIKHIEILYKRTMYSICIKKVKAAKTLAYKIENFVKLIDIIKWEKNLIHEGAIKGDNIKLLTVLHSEERQAVEKIQTQNDIRFLSYKVRDLINKMGRKNEHIYKNELRKIQNYRLLNDKHLRSNTFLISMFHIRSIICEALKETKKSHEHYLRIINIIEGDKWRIAESPANYIITLYNFIFLCSTLEKYEEMIENIYKMRSIEKKYSGNISENLKSLIFIGSYNLELKLNIELKNYKIGYLLLNDIEEGLVKFSSKVNNEDLMLCCFYTANVCFYTNCYEESLKWINKILNDKFVSHDKEIYISSLLMNVILHYELKNFNLLDYLIQSSHRFFSKSNETEEIPQIILDLISKLCIIDSKEEVFLFITKSKEQLEKSLKNIKNSEFYSCILFWMNAKTVKL